jgi:hypothetical protein
MHLEQHPNRKYPKHRRTADQAHHTILIQHDTTP